ncbi:MAG: DUF169 domain-containing protein [bacterium]|nr:DUF169 domain-containing protein [bacterium]
MNQAMKEKFATLWAKYFPGADLPIVCYYTDDESRAEMAPVPPTQRCLIANLEAVRMGRSLRFGVEAIGCGGGKRYAGFEAELMPNFAYFLSCGIPGKLEGERYKKSPELVNDFLSKSPRFQAPARYIVFKRWDRLAEADDPEVVIFFATPDVLAGLFTLANYDVSEANGVFTPFGAGCGSIILHPYLEKDAACPRAVVGMFDISARPFVPAGILSFAAPMRKFARMIDNMDESFLITASWGKVRKRL